MTLALMFKIVLGLGIALSGFWIPILAIGGFRAWRENKAKRTCALVGLTPYQQQLLWALHRVGPRPLKAIDPRPALRVCYEAGIEEWRIRVFDS